MPIDAVLAAVAARGGNPSPLRFAFGISDWLVGGAIAAALALAMALLRRRPFVTLALLLVVSLVSALVPVRWSGPYPVLHAVPAILTAVAVCFIAATRTTKLSAGAAAVAFALFTVTWVQSSNPGTSSSSVFFRGTPAVLSVALVTVIGWLIGHSIRQAHTYAESLRAQARAEQVTAERLQLARDLHDQIAHTIGVIAIQAGAGRRVINTQPEEAANALAAIEATSRETLAGLRQTVRALRRADLDVATSRPALGPQPGLADLSELAETTRKSGVDVDVRWRGERRPVPAEVDACAFRIIQEALTNVVRHAGTDRCRVAIDQRDSEIDIEVSDDGQGGRIDGAGYGITGMRERAALLHGDLTAEPRPEGGFRVVARLPLATAS